MLVIRLRVFVNTTELPCACTHGWNLTLCERSFGWNSFMHSVAATAVCAYFMPNKNVLILAAALLLCH